MPCGGLSDFSVSGFQNFEDSLHRTTCSKNNFSPNKSFFANTALLLPVQKTESHSVAQAGIVVQSQLTAVSDSQVQAILMPQPPN
ncbi:hypothetical protein AAY473_012944 [Plecturocebus cupreus]